MTSETRIYRAFTMAEALAAVKRDLGASAVILHTRGVTRKTWFGLGRRQIVEVTAVSAETARKLQQPTRQRRLAAATSSGAPAGAARRAYAAQAASATSDSAPVTEADRQRTRRLAQAMLEKHERKQTPGQCGEAAGNETVTSIKPPQAEPIIPLEKAPTGNDAEPVARRFVLREQETPNGSDGAQMLPSTPEASSRSTAEVKQTFPATRGGADWRQMQDELQAIRGMVGEVLQRQEVKGSHSTPTMPQPLFDMYLKLVAQDLSEELADEIVRDVRDELNTFELEDEGRVAEAVQRHLARYVPTGDAGEPAMPGDGRPLTIALVGPTGVGKTTTLAKLAATFKLRHGRSVGLVTSDTYRIAAVDQLRTYANIIDVPLHVALTPAEMRQAVQELHGTQVVLIDTAGRSQNDVDRISELREMIEAAVPHEVHLVLSSTASEKVLLREAESFMGVGVNKIVLTKLDEAVSFGMLVNVMHQLGRELSFVTTGQEVPDHIEVGRPDRIAELVVGGEVCA